MKSILCYLCVFSAVALALATVAQFAGLVVIPGVSTVVLAGGFISCCLVAFALGDYSRKPAFRVRRNVDRDPAADFTVNRPAGRAPDWTYSTRQK